MFTGIIEEIGNHTGNQAGKPERGAGGAGKEGVGGFARGDSIATNGVCLTAISFANREFLCRCDAGDDAA